MPTCAPVTRLLLQGLLAAVLLVPGLRAFAAGDAASPCTDAASDACYRAFTPPGVQGQLHYYASRAPDEVGALGDAGAVPTAALIALHGHPRDAGKTFGAALSAARNAGVLGRTLVVAPLFQVAAGQAGKCRSAGDPPAQPGDLLWTCASWIDGSPDAGGAGMSSFAALDALVAELVRQWPGLRTVTVAGFSAGAQMVQHYIGFAGAGTPAPAGVALRYVVADPGTWLYFDAVRPQPRRDGAAADWAACSGGADFLGGCTLDFVPAAQAACPGVDRWKYGLQALPASTGRPAAEARARYAAADVSYLEGALDSSDGAGTFYRILDKSCPALAQGPYRMQRGLAYAAYDRQRLAPAQARSVAVVPGCAHDVACVFPSAAARPALFGTAR
ncbi:MAG: hypothetical protein V4505_09945 [Pseudomonadota bacterium]